MTFDTSDTAALTLARKAGIVSRLSIFLCASLALAAAAQAGTEGDLETIGRPMEALVEPPAPTTVKLYALDCGRVEMDDMDFLADDGSMKGVSGRSVVPCFVIRHPRGDLMWDTGLSDERVGDTPDPAAAFRFRLDRSLDDKLEMIGMSPSSFEYVSFSHLHFDHAGNGNRFADATWIVDRSELDVAFSEQAKQRGESIHYEALKAARQIVIDDAAPYQVFGDASVEIHRAQGHTPGHAMLLVRTAGGAYLLTGDLWISDASQARRLVPGYNASREQTLASMDAAEALAAATRARIIRNHVIADFESLPAFPAAIE